MKKFQITLLTIIILIFCMKHYIYCFEPIILNIEGLGEIIGRQEPNGIVSFLGVPFAEPALRFSMAKEKKPWKPKQLDCTSFRPACAQPKNAHPRDSVGVSENCLTLNIWSTKTAIMNKHELSPVYSWVHGGGWIGGSASDQIFNATAVLLSQPNLVIVNIAYRLGAFGFLDLATAYPNDSSVSSINGNFGLIDQQVALQFIAKYIRNFGGDASRLVFGGQSAGAMSVALHMLIPSSSHLFSRTVIESSVFGMLYRNHDENIPYAKRFVQNMNCSDAPVLGDCLNALTMDQIITAQFVDQILLNFPINSKEYLPWAPVLDPDLFGHAAPVPQPLELFATNQLVSNVPILAGTVANETARFLPLILNSNPNDVRTIITAQFGALPALSILKHYPIDTLNPRRTLVRIETDYLWTCATYHALRNLSSVVYVYVDEHFPEHGWINGQNPWCVVNGSVCHSAELPFVWRHNQPAFDKEEAQLATIMSLFWFDGFVSSSQPHDGSPLLGVWPVLGKDQTHTMLFQTKNQTKMVRDYDKSNCDFWQKIGYRF